MRLAKHICLCTLRDADRKIAKLSSSRVMRQNRINALRNVKRETPATGSTRVVRHNPPKRVRNINRKIAVARPAKPTRRNCVNTLDIISSNIASTGSKRLVRHNLNTDVRNTRRKIAVMASTMMIGAGVLVVAQADESLTEFTRRAYIGIGGGATVLEPKTPNAALTVSSNSSAGGHVVVGYDFTSRFSAEGYYADLGKADIAFMGTDVGDINYQVFGLSAIGYLYNSRSGFRPSPQSSGMGTREGLSLFSRVGVGGVTADSDLDYKVNHSTHLALGAGAEYGFRNGFAVRGEYRALDTDQHYASVSLVKRFGKVKKAAAVPVAVAAALPEVTPTEVEAPKTASFAGVQTVNFAFDKSEITPFAANKLDEVVAVLGPSDTSIMLEGHTDWIASERYNYDLSLRRAESVRRYLESKGVDRAKISVRGFGETRPIALNDTVEGRASNRRVDIRIN